VSSDDRSEDSNNTVAYADDGEGAAGRTTDTANEQPTNSPTNTADMLLKLRPLAR
jgi:hypothetical protein